ncbi:XisI protein [Leptolyngbya sp. PCC 6406]|uniref:XisI protein n=1 Tax=Leptolyngbya sp. PCC 6406 TaxID=1173264 RepID=UPI0002ABF8B2|nr:XisI protein [Leptolyngbya sp. PCC 6406]
MDKLTIYRQHIKALLSQYAGWGKSKKPYESQLLFDETHDHYLWLDVGWDGSKRIYHPVMHFDIKDEKIWLQENMTDLNPAADLVDMGVPKADIVLGLQPPYKRPYTDYGVA